MGNFRDDNVAIFSLRRLATDIFWVWIRIPGIFAWDRTDSGGIGHPVRGDWDILFERNGFQFVDGFELVIQLPAQVFGLFGAELERGQVNQVCKRFLGY